MRRRGFLQSLLALPILAKIGLPSSTAAPAAALSQAIDLEAAQQKEYIQGHWEDEVIKDHNGFDVLWLRRNVSPTCDINGPPILCGQIQPLEGDYEENWD